MHATKNRPTEDAELAITPYNQVSQKRSSMLLEMLTLFRSTSELETAIKQTNQFPALKKATTQIHERLSHVCDTTKTIKSSLDTIIKQIDLRTTHQNQYEQIDKLRTIVDSKNILPKLEDLYDTLSKQSSSSHWKKKFKNDSSLYSLNQQSLAVIEQAIDKISTYKVFASEYEHVLLFNEVYTSLDVNTINDQKEKVIASLRLEETYNQYKKFETQLTQTIRTTWFNRKGSTITDQDINQTTEVQEARNYLKKQAVHMTAHQAPLPKNSLSLLDTVATTSLYHHIQGRSLSYIMNRIPYQGFNVTVPKSDNPDKIKRHIKKQTKETLSKLETTALQTSLVQKICTQNKDTHINKETLAEMMSMYHAHLYNEENTKRNSAYMQTLDSLYDDVNLGNEERKNITLFSFAYYLRHHNDICKTLENATEKEKKRILADYTKETIQKFDTLASKYHHSKMQDYVNKHKQQHIREDSLDFLRLYNHIDILSRRAKDNNKQKTTILFSAKDINPNQSYN